MGCGGVVSPGLWFLTDPSCSDTFEFWLKAFTRHLATLWRAYKVEHKAEGVKEAQVKEAFVASVDPSVKSYLQFVVKTIVLNDCFDSLPKLATHLEEINKEYPSIVPSMLATVLELAKAKVEDEAGLAPWTTLSFIQLKAFTEGALWNRYLKERLAGRYSVIRAATAMTHEKRLEGIAAILMNPNLGVVQKMELSTMRQLLSGDVPESEKVSYLLADPQRVAVLSDWAPNHELLFVGRLVDGADPFRTSKDWVHFLLQSKKYLTTGQISEIKDVALRNAVQDIREPIHN